MFCSSCGAEVEEGASFCSNCGKAIKVNGTAIAKEAVLPTKKRSKMNVWGVIASVVVVISMLIPALTLDYFNSPMRWNLLEHDGGTVSFVILVCAVVSGVLSALGKNVFTIVAGILALFNFWMVNATISRMMGDVTPEEIGNLFLTKNPGYYLFLLGAIGMIAAGIAGIVQKKNNRNA